MGKNREKCKKKPKMKRGRWGRISSKVEGPLWAGTEGFVRTSAQDYNVNLDHIEVERGPDSELVVFEVSGFESNLMRFKKALEKAFEGYNAERTPLPGGSE